MSKTDMKAFGGALEAVINTQWPEVRARAMEFAEALMGKKTHIGVDVAAVAVIAAGVLHSARMVEQKMRGGAHIDPVDVVEAFAVLTHALMLQPDFTKGMSFEVEPPSTTH